MNANGGRASPSVPIIEARGISRSFNGTVAVRDLSLTVDGGEILGLIGPSGSGKTTTIRMLTGTLAPSAGEAVVLGEDPMHFSRRARAELAYMPQLFSLYPDLTVRENVGFVAALYGIGVFRRGKLIRRALEVVELWDVRDRLARNLSGGMQRRLELACALVHTPSVLFVDEPTAGIDPMLRKTIWDELRRLRDEGRTLLVTTQYVGEAEYCDRVALIADGELVALDAPDKLRRLVFGGEVIMVEGEQPVHPQLLAPVEGVESVRQLDERRLVVVAADASIATPRLIEALRSGGIGVARVGEYRPSFDEVFAALVEQNRSRRPPPDVSDDG